MIRIRESEQRLPRGVQRLDEQEIVFGGGTAGRVFCGIFACVFAACAFFMLWMTMSHPQYLAQAWSYFTASAYGAVAVAAWYAAGPRETAFDLRRGTYRLTTGFPFFPRVRQGTRDEVAGLYVAGFMVSGSTSRKYVVRLAWKEPRRGDIVLFSSFNGAVADQFMRRTADMLGVPAGEEALKPLWFRNPRLRRCDDTGLTFHKSPGVRLAWGITGKAIAVASLIFSGALIVTPGGLHFHNGSMNLGIVLLDILGLLCLRAAGPEDLEIDLANRIYRCRCGFPYISRPRTGPLEEVIAIKTDNQGTSGGSRVRLVWKQPRRGDMTLGEFRSPEEADAHRRLIAERLDWDAA